MSVVNSHVSNSSMGIVVSDAAKNISVTGNQVSAVERHGIALLDGVTSSSVTGNVVDDGRIYLRDSQASIQGNTVLHANGHAVSVVGSAAGTLIANNVVGGAGASAIDTARANGSIIQRGNTAGGWRDTTAIVTRIKNTLLHPMTLLWAAILALVVLSIVRGVGRRRPARGIHPYAHQTAHLRGRHA